MSVADEAGVPHPTIVSESGRATVAHHSVLLFNVLDVSRFEPHGMPGDAAGGRARAAAQPDGGAQTL